MEDKLRATKLADIVEDTRQVVDNESNEEKGVCLIFNVLSDKDRDIYEHLF